MHLINSVSLLVLAFLRMGHVDGSNYCASTVFCVIGIPSADGSSICLTVQGTAKGWVGLGVGSSVMSGADMYIGWRNSSGGITLTNRLGTGHRMPDINKAVAPDQIQLVPTPSNVNIPLWVSLVFTVCRPMSVSTSNIGPSTNYIFAMSDSGPTTPDSSTSDFPVHSSEDSFSADLTQSSNSTKTGDAPEHSILTLPDSITIDVIYRIHGVLMLIAWAVSPFAGIFIARFMKDHLGVWWYRLHLFFMLGVTGCLTAASFILIFLYYDPPHFQDAHAQLGLSVVILMVCQFVLGFISNHLWTPDRLSIPWWDKTHWWIGRILVLLGIVNIHLGLQDYSEKAYPVSPLVFFMFWLCVAIQALVLVGFEFRMGVVHHVKSA